MVKKTLITIIILTAVRQKLINKIPEIISFLCFSLEYNLSSHDHRTIKGLAVKLKLLKLTINRQSELQVVT